MNDRLALAAGSIEITAEQRAKTLELIREHGRGIGDRRALREAGVEGRRSQLNELLATDEELAEEIAVARGRDPEVIRDEIKRRAIEGVVEDVYGSLGQGQGAGVVGQRIVYSDRLLEMMAKAHLPEYRDRVEHTGAGGGPLEVTNPDVAAALDRFTSNIRRLAERHAEPGGAVRDPEPGAAALPPGAAGD